MLNSAQSRLRRLQGLQKPRTHSPPAASFKLESEDEIEQIDEAAPEILPTKAISDRSAQWLDFARDCGAGAGMAIRVKPAGAASQSVAVRSGLVLVGRGPQCTLRIPGDAVADKHLLALFLEGRFFVCDLGSPGGTWLGSRKVAANWVPSGSALRIGDSQIVLEGPLAPEVDSGPDGDGDAPDGRMDGGEADVADELWLRFPRRNEDQRFQLKKSVTVFGRDARCGVRISSQSVSRFHCVLVKTASGIWVADLASREGIRVNGERVHVARLDDDCELTVGRASLFLQRGAELPDAESPDDAPVHFESLPAGYVSESFVRELLSEFRKAQRETMADMTALVRESLQAAALPAARGAKLESLLARIESRVTRGDTSGPDATGSGTT
jgi:pSer/pThr/pTyr-binding forkhead associated (FHA) protein